MGASMMMRGRNTRIPKRAEAGFSLLEVMISIVVLTVGLVSLLGVFGLAMASTQGSQQNMIAKQLANEAYESIETARNSGQVTWDDIQNTGSANCFVTGAASCGIFAIGAQPMCTAQTTGQYSGILGTTSVVSGTTCTTSEQTLQDPGPDGIFLTADDTFIPLTGYQRKIAFSKMTNASSETITSLRQINITVQYTNPQTANQQQTYVLSSYISQYQ